jgi:putative hemolysin
LNNLQRAAGSSWAGVPPERGGAASKPANWQFEATWAGCEADVRAAQRLRHTIFVGEMKARLAPPPGTPDGLDADYFDPYCDHLLIRVKEQGSEAPGQLVGTYRVLAPDAARRAGACYTETEFDLAPLAPLRGGAVELGRACVHADWRSGGVILSLWSELGNYMVERGLHTMFGCASIGMADGGELARRVWRELRESNYLVRPEYRIRPLTPLPENTDHDGADADVERAGAKNPALRDLPPLIKGYLRCGARVVGPPSFDRLFNTADLPIMMQLADLPQRYSKQFLARR